MIREYRTTWEWIATFAPFGAAPRGSVPGRLQWSQIRAGSVDLSFAAAGLHYATSGVPVFFVRAVSVVGPS